MTIPSVVKGQYFDVAVFKPAIGSDPADTTTPSILCGLTTRNFQNSFQTSDEYLRDCADPEMVPVRSLNVTGESYQITGNGAHNRALAPLIRAIKGKPFKYRFIEGEPADDAVDSGYWEGDFVLIDIQLGATDGVNVTAQYTFASDGVITWHDAA